MWTALFLVMFFGLLAAGMPIFLVLEAFVAGIDSCEDDEARELLGLVCDLYALTVIEDDKAWFVEHRFLSTERAKAVTRGINDRCRLLRPHAETLVDGFGIPPELRYADMLHPEKLPEPGAAEDESTDSALLHG